MSPEMQLAVACGGGMASILTALVVAAIAIRLFGVQEEGVAAAEERGALMGGQRTLLDRIERLKERTVVQQFLLVDGRRWDFLAVGPGHIDAGGVPVPASEDLYERLRKHPGADIEIVILKKGMGSLLSAIPKGGGNESE